MKGDLRFVVAMRSRKDGGKLREVLKDLRSHPAISVTGTTSGNLKHPKKYYIFAGEEDRELVRHCLNNLGMAGIIDWHLDQAQVQPA